MFVFLRHGILSSARKMADLALAIENGLVGSHSVLVDNHSYSWRDSVLLNGIKLAAEISRAWTDDRNQRCIVLVGHSQGGLVCRIAAAALLCNEDLGGAISEAGYIDGPSRNAAIRGLQELQSFEGVAERLRGVITLATPNSGAVTFGQLALCGRACLSIAQLVGATGIAVNLGDLTTDRLFRILQRVKVEGVNYLSISGSAVNRFSFMSHADLSEVPVLSRLGLHLALPNDWIVEDESTNIENAVLPPEIANIKNQYEHVRWYPDCSQVNHSGIHRNKDVRTLVIKRILEWCSHDSRDAVVSRSSNEDRVQLSLGGDES